MPDHHSQVIIATAGPSLPDHHRPPPSHRHTHTTPPPPSPGLRDHVVIRCSQHPSHAAASPQQAYLPPNRIRLGFPQGQHSMRDESKPLLTVNPVAKPRVQHQIRLSQKQDTTRAKIAKNRGCTIEMHQAPVIAGAKKTEGHCRSLLLDSTVLARPSKRLLSAYPPALWETPWVVSDADLAGVCVLALFLKLLRHTVFSLWWWWYLRC
jgi:hypothetical protein